MELFGFIEAYLWRLYSLHVDVEMPLISRDPRGTLGLVSFLHVTSREAVIGQVDEKEACDLSTAL